MVHFPGKTNIYKNVDGISLLFLRVLLIDWQLTCEKVVGFFFWEILSMLLWMKIFLEIDLPQKYFRKSLWIFPHVLLMINNSENRQRKIVHVFVNGSSLENVDLIATRKCLKKFSPSFLNFFLCFLLSFLEKSGNWLLWWKFFIYTQYSISIEFPALKVRHFQFWKLSSKTWTKTTTSSNLTVCECNKM